MTKKSSKETRYYNMLSSKDASFTISDESSGLIDINVKVDTLGVVTIEIGKNCTLRMSTLDAERFINPLRAAVFRGIEYSGREQ